MSELERSLQALAARVEWPPTPGLALPAGAARRRRRAPLVLALAALVALGVAFAVPGARSAILRALHLEGVTIERVAVLPPAQERPLGAALGRAVDEQQAAKALGRPVPLPPLTGPPRLHLEHGVVSVLLSDPEPLLLSELQTGGGASILQKTVGYSTGVQRVRVGGAPGVWISGAEHVYVVPTVPPRLAGNVLLWAAGGILYRLEGRGLSERAALALAATLRGT
jgi:hypothetical protein